MKRYVLILLLLVSFPLRAEIYKWTDSNGIVHFSDKAYPGASQVNLPPSQTFSSPPNPSSTPPAGNASGQNLAPEQAAVDYRITISEPADQETIRNNQGFIPISVVIEPELQKGNTAQLILDNTPVGNPQTTTAFSVKDIDRGSHTIAIQILDEKGEVVTTSESITVFMQRPRVNMGNNSSRPPAAP